MWVGSIGGICEHTMKSVLRWAGSKRKLLPKLSEYFKKPYERYVEAFAGSASFFFHIAPSKALLNDVNGDLISAYKVLRRSPTRLHAAIMRVGKSEAAYYRERDRDPSMLSEFDRAVKFFYLNRLCFNGIYRTNKEGKFNVPFGGEKAGKFPNLQEWIEASALLKRAELSSSDFEEFLRENARPGDFVYLDPPYAVSNRRIFRQYSPQTFGLEDVGRLTQVLDELHARKCDFVISYAKSPETKRLASNWNVTQTLAQRNVAGFSEHRRKAVEVLITNIE